MGRIGGGLEERYGGKRRFIVRIIVVLMHDE